MSMDPQATQVSNLSNKLWAEVIQIPFNLF